MSENGFKKGEKVIYVEDHVRGLEVARDFAQWELGDESWADEIINAYLKPTEAENYLEAEGFYE